MDRKHFPAQPQRSQQTEFRPQDNFQTTTSWTGSFQLMLTNLLNSCFLLEAKTSQQWMFLWLLVKPRPGSLMINLLYSETKNCEKKTARIYFILVGNSAKGIWPVKEKGRTTSLLHSIFTPKCCLSLHQQDKAPKSYNVKEVSYQIIHYCVKIPQFLVYRF